MSPGVASLALTGCAAILIGCGGDEEPATTAPSAATTTTRAEKTTTPGERGKAPIEGLVATAAGVRAERVECGEEGIERALGGGGTCAAERTEYVVADRGRKAKLDTLDARLDEVSSRKTVRGDHLKPRDSKRGRFVVATLAITNTSDRKAVFDDFGQQVRLFAGGEAYDEPFNVLNGVATDSFLWKAKNIKPGETQLGQVVFDVPKGAISSLETDGAILVLNFGDEGDLRRARQVGLLRTG